ncbi:hypothetical protein [Aquimarina algiphila]|uniref:Portal protein n=1 Tax=Aquimarina algiphila TaxID=2047982 RepID=A0A554VRN8_9FLAO|nr:hypothetical protein [Aquimarina algiphila]TSE11288.1 hypothetical protein FOF46_01270 [Aquimarina algiphila]
MDMETKMKRDYFPDPLASDEEKKGDAYGLQAAKAISLEWFNGGMISNGADYKNRRERIVQNRLFSRGKQSIDRDKNIAARNQGDLNYMNMDWSPLNIAGKFVDIVANGIREDLYRLDISAIDSTAALEKKKFKEGLKKKMVAAPMLEKANQMLGIDLRDEGYIPEDNEDIEMHTELAFKPKIEIAEELLIKYVKSTNNWKLIKEMVDKDIVENALGVVRVYTDKYNGVVVKYVDIENFIHSYVRKKDFSDAHYFAEVDTITLSQIQQESGYDEATLRKIAEKYATQNTNQGQTILDFRRVKINEVLNYKINVLRFTFRTSKNITYKKRKNKHGSFTMVKRESTYTSKRSENERVAKTLDTWYEGNFIMGSDYIYGYKESEILARDKNNRAMPCFIARSSNIYNNRLNSFVDTIEPIDGQMQRIHLKTQQLIAELRPDGVEIDIDMLAELSTKSGKKLTWEDALNLFNSKGIVFSTRADLGDEGIKDRAALRTPTSAQSTKLEQLVRAWLHYYNIIRDLTGVNAARDGSTPSDTLVGVQQMQILQSNTATQGIVDASMEITKKTCETISTRLGDIFRFGKDLKDVYTNAVGSQNLEAVRALEDRHLHEFGFIIQMLPTEVEMQEFKESMGIALQEGSITVDDKIKAERIALMNIKQAETYLTYRRKKSMKEKEEEQMRQIQAQSQSNAQAAMQAEQAKRETMQFETQLAVQLEKEKAMIEVMKQAELNKVNQAKEEREYQVEIFVEKLKSLGREQETMYKEDRKDKRQDLIDTNMSKMISQRQQENSAPINFENRFNIKDAAQSLQPRTTPQQ